MQIVQKGNTLVVKNRGALVFCSGCFFIAAGCGALLFSYIFMQIFSATGATEALESAAAQNGLPFKVFGIESWFSMLLAGLIGLVGLFLLLIAPTQTVVADLSTRLLLVSKKSVLIRRSRQIPFHDIDAIEIREYEKSFASRRSERNVTTYQYPLYAALKDGDAQRLMEGVGTSTSIDNGAAKNIQQIGETLAKNIGVPFRIVRNTPDPSVGQSIVDVFKNKNF